MGFLGGLRRGYPTRALDLKVCPGRKVDLLNPALLDSESFLEWMAAPGHLQGCFREQEVWQFQGASPLLQAWKPLSAGLRPLALRVWILTPRSGRGFLPQKGPRCPGGFPATWRRFCCCSESPATSCSFRGLLLLLEFRDFNDFLSDFAGADGPASRTFGSEEQPGLPWPYGPQ